MAQLLTWQSEECLLLDQDQMTEDDEMVTIENPHILDSASCSEPMDLDLDLQTIVTSHQTHINDLPTEIITRIFTNLLPIEDNVPDLGLVCKKWRDILKTSGAIWRTIHVDPVSYDWSEFSTLSAILKNYGNHVRNLTWRNNAPVYDPIFSMCCQLHNLHTLKLPIKWNRDVILKMAPLSQLRQVEIHGGFALVDSDLQLIALQFPKLSQVSLSACWAITAQGLYSFLERLTCLRTLKLKINSCLPLSDPRSENSIIEGACVVHLVSTGWRAATVTVLCLHYLPIHPEHLWATVGRLPNLRKLSVSNCQNLTSVRIESTSLQKLYMYNLQAALFVSITAPRLRLLRVDHGMESMEHLEVTSPRLNRLHIDGSNVLRTIHVTSRRLQVLELYHCENIEIGSFKNLLMDNKTVVCLKIGKVSQENLTLDEASCPSIQELVLLSDFSCNALHVRSPTLRFIHTQSDRDLHELNHAYIIGNHLCKVSLVGVPALKSVVVQCVSVDAIELNLCSDDPLHLESCIVQAMCSIGFLRLFKCHVKLLSVSTPMARTLALYRCNMSDYVLQMALGGCVNIDYLCVERCRQLSKLDVTHQPMKYLNLFGCSDIGRVHVESENLIGVNLGHCPKVRLFIDSFEEDLVDPKSDLDLVLPHQSVRWSHDYPPESYVFPYR